MHLYIWPLDIVIFPVWQFSLNFDNTWKYGNKKSGWGTKKDTCGLANI